MATSDHAYTNLLAHLHSSNLSLPLSTIQSALTYYLVHLKPLPTPLAATAVSSSLYLTQPFTHEKLQSLLTAFRHATHLKHRALIENVKRRSRVGNLFQSSPNAALGQWIDDIMKGIQGGHSVLRLSCLSGVFLAIYDLELETRNQTSRQIELGSAKDNIEGELTVAVAEVIDNYSYGTVHGSPSEWEKEFQPNRRDTLILALVIASQSLPLISRARFEVLPLPALVRLVVDALSSTFQSGKLLHDLGSSVGPQGDYRIHIPPGSSFAKSLQTITASPLHSSVASLSRLAALSLQSLIGSYSNSRIADGLRVASETLQVWQNMTNQVEQDWNTGPLVDVSDPDIAPESQPITKAIWITLKTMLFSTIMLSDAILSSIVYVLPHSSPYSRTSIAPSALALQVLHILSHLAFIISQFGGVTSTSQGFEQLKKTFYLALDILTHVNCGNQPGVSANAYVKEQCLALKSSAITRAPRTIQSAKRALVLASVEQLVPVLDEECIRDYVFGICHPYLSDPSHRETFESAHSVILAIFASHAQKQQQRQTESPGACVDGSTLQSNLVADLPPTQTPADFVKKMVPFYAHCLIENSGQGRLSIPQLRLAYSALVGCAGSSSLDHDIPTEEALALAWYCVEVLLDAIRVETSRPQSRHQNNKNSREEDILQRDAQRLHRLHLTLISTVPSLPLLLMLQVLEEIKIIILNYPPSARGADLGKAGEEGERNQLVKALFTELLDRVGYRERSFVMQWWYQNRMELQNLPGQDGDTLSPS